MHSYGTGFWGTLVYWMHTATLIPLKYITTISSSLTPRVPVWFTYDSPKIPLKIKCDPFHIPQIQLTNNDNPPALFSEYVYRCNICRWHSEFK